jgi:hypothetical protein
MNFKFKGEVFLVQKNFMKNHNEIRKNISSNMNKVILSSNINVNNGLKLNDYSTTLNNNNNNNDKDDHHIAFKSSNENLNNNCTYSKNKISTNTFDHQHFMETMIQNDLNKYNQLQQQNTLSVTTSKNNKENYIDNKNTFNSNQSPCSIDSNNTNNNKELKLKDSVNIDLNFEIVQSLQAGHGGWCEEMFEVYINF